MELPRAAYDALLETEAQDMSVTNRVVRGVEADWRKTVLARLARQCSDEAKQRYATALVMYLVRELRGLQPAVADPQFGLVNTLLREFQGRKHVSDLKTELDAFFKEQDAVFDNDSFPEYRNLKKSIF